MADSLQLSILSTMTCSCCCTQSCFGKENENLYINMDRLIFVGSRSFQNRLAKMDKLPTFFINKTIVAQHSSKLFDDLESTGNLCIANKLTF